MRRAWVMGLALPLAWWPWTATPAMSVRFVVVTALAVAGAPSLVRRARSGDGPAQLATVLVGWVTLAVLVAGEPVGVTGDYPGATGAVMWWGVVGAWSLGRDLDPAGRRAAVRGVVVGAAVNAVVGLVQYRWDLGIDQLGLFDGRSVALTGNPVFLAALCAAALALVPAATHEVADGATPPTNASPAVVVGACLVAASLGGVVETAGSRTALVSVSAVIVWLLVASERRRRAIPIAAALGVVVATALPGAAATSATDRLRAPSLVDSGITQRVETLHTAARAVARAPFTGAGPGGYVAATLAERDEGDVRAIGGGRVFDDAHDLPMTLAVTTGVPGAVVATAWLGATVARRRRRRRDAIQDAAMAATVVLLVAHLTEPLGLLVTPLLGLLAGVAVGEQPAPPANPPSSASLRIPRRALGVVLVAIVAAPVLVGDLAARRALLDFDRHAADVASTWMWPWAAPEGVRARIAIFDVEANDRPERAADARRFAAAALDRQLHDPTSLELWGALASRQATPPRAVSVWDQVLELHPWSPLALAGRDRARDAVGDDSP